MNGQNISLTCVLEWQNISTINCPSHKNTDLSFSIAWAPFLSLFGSDFDIKPNCFWTFPMCNYLCKIGPSSLSVSSPLTESVDKDTHKMSFWTIAIATAVVFKSWRVRSKKEQGHCLLWDHMTFLQGNKAITVPAKSYLHSGGFKELNDFYDRKIFYEPTNTARNFFRWIPYIFSIDLSLSNGLI